MHTILTTQLKTVPDSVKQAIHPLPTILEGITKAGEEEEGDPFSATFEALRVMQTTISQFNPNSGGENSESSSEYTTPAQSQTTSPSHEQSPPPPGAAMQAAHATVGSAAKLLTQQNNGNGGDNQSPTTSPTHSDRVSSLATHSHHAGSKVMSASGVARSRTTQPGESSTSLDVPPKSGGSHRRKSDPEVTRHRVRPASQQLPGTSLDTSRGGQHGHSRSIDHAIK